MAKRKTTKKPARKTAKRKTKHDPQRTRTITIASVGVVGALMLTGAGWVGIDRLDARAGDVLSRGQAPVVFEWPALDPNSKDPQTWMPASEQERLRTIAADALAGAPGLDVTPLRKASRALTQTGWFVGEARVERLGDGTVRVSGAWRVYAGVVRVGWLERLIAWDGVALPLEYDEGKSGLRYLANPSQGTPPKPGATTQDPWGGEDIAGGLELLRLLDRDPGVIDQVAGIDLKHGGPIEIVTTTGARILWGAAPGAYKPGEVSADMKLDRLAKLMEMTGRIDANSAWIEITGPYVLEAPKAPGG